MNGVRPLKDVAKKEDSNRIASTRWVARYVRQVLGRFHLDVTGGTLEQTGDGGLHLSIDQAGADNAAFSVTLAGQTATIQPGIVDVYDYSRTIPHHTFEPLVGGKALTQARTLTVTPSGKSYIALRMQLSRNDGGAYRLPWSIVATTILKNTALERYTGTVEGQDGETDWPIATINADRSITQHVSSIIVVRTVWNTIYVSP